jgi:site-specific DNA-methyltransferase (adenine-specific)
MSALSTIADVLGGHAQWCVACVDNRAAMASLPPASIDHVITDPPYSDATHKNARTLGTASGEMDINFAALPDYDWTLRALAVTRAWVLGFCELEMLGDYRRAVGERYLRGGVWDRPDGTPQLSGDRPAQAAEGIAIMHSRVVKPEWSAGGKRGMWRHGVERDERHHPTPKPVPLMLELVADFTKQGELVLDPFCGSGTTGVAAIRLQRRFIGIELDPKYAQVARERLEAETRGLSLSAARVGQIALFEPTVTPYGTIEARPKKAV